MTREAINKLIKTAWTLALLAIAGMAVYPPWVRAPHDSANKQTLGYHPIWVGAEAVSHMVAANEKSQGKPVAVDTSELIIQSYIALAIAMGATIALAIFRPERPTE